MRGWGRRGGGNGCWCWWGMLVHDELAWDRDRERGKEMVLEDLYGCFVLKPVRHVTAERIVEWRSGNSNKTTHLTKSTFFLSTEHWIKRDSLDIQLTSPSFPLLILLLLLLFFNFLYSVALSRSNMFFFQLVIMSGTVLLAYYMECTDLFSVHVQGFFCNDAELMKPYPGTEESSFVPPLILYCVVAAAPTAVVSKNPFYVYFFY